MASGILPLPQKFSLLAPLFADSPSFGFSIEIASCNFYVSAAAGA